MATYTERTKPAMVSGSRIFLPAEVERIQRVITKPSLLALFNLLLFTGMRLSEVSELARKPLSFDECTKVIKITSTKAKATQKSRDIWLNDQGVNAVKEYLKYCYVPSSPSVWQTNLIRWCRQAHLIEDPYPDSPSNPYAVTVRTSRKTWESWLMKSFKHELTAITLSMGHTETTALRHYTNMTFLSGEIEQIKEYTAGWLREE